ncbi:hypothetical protein BDV29DRAFT_151635 [Aspergillus leporis]|jgi:hypothetical protein|uniref:Uncharacterized protein n=1 Tax=Aspergillus leporis TaxID=41062 RepID=A0A5N5XKP0_9EURO|nr:hypothetical protein BDV29DRAFT_151635 [Aspergillus leporis]
MPTSSVDIGAIGFLQAICLKAPGLMSRYIATHLALAASRGQYLRRIARWFTHHLGEEEKAYALVVCKEKQVLAIGPDAGDTMNCGMAATEIPQSAGTRTV